MQVDEHGLVKAALKGNGAAIDDIIELFYAKVYAFLKRLSGSDSDAADLTQRTFGSVWQSLPRFAGRSSVSSWIHSIAYHTYVDWRRTNHRGESRSPEWWADRMCHSPRPDEVASRNDLAASLYTAVDGLDPDLRETVHLHYYQELTLEETAEAMGIATSTVKYRLRQALTELERKMNPRTAAVGSPDTCKRI